MTAIGSVFRKEMMDGRRDKRAVMSAFMFPILGPVLVYFMMTAIINLRSDAESTVVPVKGMEHAPAMIQWLAEHQVKITPFEGDPREAVKSKEVELVIVIRADFQERFRDGRPAVVEVVQDGSRSDARITVNRVESLLRQYSNQIAALRLVARGVSPELIRTISIDGIDVASRQQRAAAALNFIPMYIILAAFVAGMGIAIDSTAGERERKSLEPLLINPVDRYQIVVGKWLAAGVFAGLGMILTAVLCILAMSQVPLEEIGLSFSITPLQLFIILAATAPLALLATAIQLALGMFAKSFKDAQSYMGLLVILPMVPSLYMTFNPVATRNWMFAVPALGQQLLLVDLIGGKAIPPIGYVLSAVSCLVIGLCFVLLTARLFQKESIVTS